VVVAVNQAVRAKAEVASLGAAAKAAAVKGEEAGAEVAAGVAARGEPSRPILRPSSKIDSLCRTKHRALRFAQPASRPPSNCHAR
jgi:hypothetical protein